MIVVTFLLVVLTVVVDSSILCCPLSELSQGAMIARNFGDMLILAHPNFRECSLSYGYLMRSR